MVLHITSFNINGGQAPLRRVQTIQGCESLKADIILQQETHATNTLVAEWGRLFKGQWFLSGFPTPKAVILLKGIFFSILKDFIKDLESTAFICIAGDFNFTVCPSLDRNSHETHAASTKIVGSIIKQYELKDYIFPNTDTFTAREPNLEDRWGQIPQNLSWK
uniref:Endonuclease/exonuclease/phosphatase domain-containing protein n=1 Tax=Eptatretus burgeri TaxID=7764 RepID=A0A8C4QPH2_EPTBU